MFDKWRLTSTASGNSNTCGDYGVIQALMFSGWEMSRMTKVVVTYDDNSQFIIEKIPE